MSDIKTNNVWLMKGDCLERMKEIESGSVDLTVTSPPYDNLRTYNNSLDWGEHVWKNVLQELFRVTKQGGVVVWVVGDATIKGSETGTSFKQALYAKEIGFNLHDTMIYQTNKPPMNDKRYQSEFEYVFIFSKGKPAVFNAILIDTLHPNVTNKGGNRNKDGTKKERTYENKTGGKKIKGNIWYIPRGSRSGDEYSRKHPATFPDVLANDHIISWSNEGDTVLDCFMGSGTTGKMSLINSRKFIGIEKDAEYFDIGTKRILGATQ